MQSHTLRLGNPINGPNRLKYRGSLLRKVMGVEKSSGVCCLNTRLVDVKDSLTVSEGKEGMTRSILWQY